MQMEVRYVPSIVVLSVSVAMLASYVALNLSYSVTQARGRSQAMWLTCGAIAMGVGIWSMHFVGMLAFEMPGMEMAYDVPLMVLSIAVAVCGSALALFIVSRPVVHPGSVAAGGIAMAAAIAGMHYIGMYSMRMAARIEWDLFLVSLSVLIALVASWAALLICIRLRHRPGRALPMLGASALMGIAISGMHYVGMFAATFIHDYTVEIQRSDLLVTSGLTTTVVAMTLLILGLALFSSIGQRVLDDKQKRSDEILSTSRALEEREAQLRTITNAAPILLAQVHPNGTFMFANNSFCDWFNCTAADVRSMTFEGLLGPEKFTENKLYIQRVLAGETVTYERDSTSGDRRAILNITFVPELDFEGGVKSFIIVAANVSRYKEIELELYRAKEAAEVANETKSAFLANMSHEIRTPLGAVLGFSELIVDGDLSVSERYNTIEIIKRNGKVLSTLINDILDLSKVEAGKLEVEQSEVNLRELLNEIATLLRLEADAKGIQFKVVASGVVPGVIRTDATRLRQVLFNIVGNAIKFTDRGEVELRVKIFAADTNLLAFYVTDSGTGIAAEHVARLFAPFSQADVTTTRRFGGTGLGLALSKKLATALGGDVVLESTQFGKGSTFLITIDHGQGPDVLKNHTEVFTGIESAIADPGRSATHDLKGLKILVVDDSADNLALVKRILVANHAEVETAINGREGMEAALARHFDAIVMDLQMPVMDGHQAVRALRAKGYGAPVFALTAHAMKEERMRCLEDGFDDHLTKPVDRTLLLSMILRHVRAVDAESSHSLKPS